MPEITWSAITASPTLSKGDSPPPRPIEITPLMSPCKAASFSVSDLASPPPATATTPGPPAISASRLRPVTARMVTRFLSSQTDLDSAGIARLQVAITRQRPEWEEFRIAVIVEIEDARKTTAGVMRLGPQPVRTLRAFQIRDAARHGGMIHLSCRHQAQKRPGGL